MPNSPRLKDTVADNTALDDFTTEGDEILYCDVDTSVSKHYRDAWGFFRDRRPEVYREVTAP